MSSKILILVVIAVLVVGVLALAFASGPPASAQPAPYRLTTLTTSVKPGLAGGLYRLDPLAPTIRGNGCCCMYIPCALQNSP